MSNRETIQRIRTELEGRNIIKPGIVATQGYLRLAVNLQATALNAVTFNVLSNQGTTRATERRLDITDMFTITHWGLFILKAGTTTAATDAEIAASKLYTNPNAGVFTGTGESANLMNIYNGFLSVTVDRERIIDSYDSYRFYRAGVAQNTVLSAVGGPYNADEWQGPNYGMAEVSPEITLNGVGDNNITLQLPSSVNLSGTTSTNFVFMVARGIRWQNASKLNA
jgi:hypothetical protein